MTMLKPTMKHPLTETNNLKDVRKMRQRKIENGFCEATLLIKSVTCSSDHVSVYIGYSTRFYPILWF